MYKSMMRKRVAVLLILCLLFVLSPAGAMAEDHDSNGKPSHSTYVLTTTLPSAVTVNEATYYKIALRTDVPGHATYGNVYFSIDTNGPGDAFFSTSVEDRNVTFVNDAEWSKKGFQLPPEFNQSYGWKVTFDRTGVYQLTYKVTSQDGTVIAESSQSVQVLLPVSEYALNVELPAQLGVGEYVNVPVTLTTSALGMNGVNQAHWRVGKTAGEAQVVLMSPDTQGEAQTFLDVGDWGLPGFDVPAQADMMSTWTVKLGTTGAVSLRFELVDAAGQTVAAADKTVEAVPRFENLGPQAFNQLIMRAQLGREDGRDVAYTVLAGEEALFAVVDVKTEELIRQIPVKGAAGAWGITVATDGKVYIGTYGTASLYVYDPASLTVTKIGDPVSAAPGLPATTQFFEMKSGKNGKVYGGVYPSGSVFEYDPAKGFTNFGQIYPDTQYPETVAYDEEQNVLYVGGGGTRSYLIRLDLNTGEKKDILPDTYATKATILSDMNVIDDRLYLKFNNFSMVVMDKNSFQVYSDKEFVHSRSFVKSPLENKVYFTYGGILKTYNVDTNTVEPVTLGGKPVNLFANAVGWEVVELNEPDFPGYTLLGFGGNLDGYFFKFNLQTGNLKLFNMPLPKLAFGLYSIGSGPDGKIYSGAILQGGMGIFNPADRSVQSYSFPQTEGMTYLGKYMYFSTYPGAKIHQYDTTRTFKASGSGRTVNQMFELKTGYEQDRPNAMLAVPQEQKLFIGSIPDYGKLGGALTVYEPSKPGVNYEVFRNIVPNHSIISLAYKDGLVYGGSSFRGGLGSDEKYDDARLFIFDVATRKKIFETVPVPGKGAITCLMNGPDGNIWGFAMGTFFIFDPNTRQVVYSQDAFPEAINTWADAKMEISRKDGNVYGTINDKFFRIDKETRQIAVLRNEKANRLAQDNYGNFYFADYTNLIRYVVEDNTLKVTGVRLDSGNATVSAGQTYKLIAQVQPVFATLKNVKWTSSNSSVATVDANGNVKGVNPGQAVITVTTVDGNKQATAVVTVQ